MELNGKMGHLTTPNQTSSGLGRPLSSRSCPSLRQSYFARAVKSPAEDKRREIPRSEAFYDEQERLSETRADEPENSQLLITFMQEKETLHHSINPTRLQDLVPSSEESHSVTSDQAVEEVQNVSETEDRTALVRVLDNVPLWPTLQTEYTTNDDVTNNNKRYLSRLQHHPNASVSVESLALTEESSVTSLSNFPWPPAIQSGPTSAAFTAPSRSTPQTETGELGKSRDNYSHHRAASSTTLGNSRGFYIHSNESPLFRRVFNGQQFERSLGRSSDASLGSSVQSLTDEWMGMDRVHSPENRSIASSKSNRSNTPSRITFEDLPTAHETITARTRSKSGTRPRQEIPTVADLLEAQRHGALKPGRLRKRDTSTDEESLPLNRPTMKIVASSLTQTQLSDQPYSSNTLAPIDHHPMDHPSGNSRYSWRGRLSNVFQRKLEPQEDDGRGRVRPSATMPLPEVANRTSTALLRPASQSISHNSDTTFWPQDDENDAQGSMPGRTVAHHQRQCSSVYQNSTGGTPVGSIRASHFLDPDGLASELVKSHIEFADDLHREISLPSEDGSSRSKNQPRSKPNPNAESADDFEEVRLESDAEDSDDDGPRRQSNSIGRRRSGFSLFDFGLGSRSSKSSSRAPSTADSHRSSAPVSTNGHAGAGQHPHRHFALVASTFEDFSLTRPSSGRVPSLIPPDSAAPTLPSRSSLRSGSLLSEHDSVDIGGDHTEVGWVPFSFGHTKIRHEPEIYDSNEIATFRVARPSTEGPPSALGVRHGSNASGQRQGSGWSDMKSSIVVFNENGIQEDGGAGEDDDDDAQGQGVERRVSYRNLGPGSLQSSSSRGFLSHRASTASDDSGHGGSDGASIYQGNEQAKTIDADDHIVSTPSPMSSQEEFTDRCVGASVEVDEVDDWETIGGSEMTSRGNTRATLAHTTTLSDLVDQGSQLSWSSPLQALSHNSLRFKYPIHAADERYEHVYRVRESVPDGIPVLLPSYHYPGGMSFPNRNAMNAPLPRLPGQHRYQHPAPLFPEHRHPFQLPPPKVMIPANKGLPRSGVGFPMIEERVGEESFLSSDGTRGTSIKHSHCDVSDDDSVEYNDPQGSFHSVNLTEDLTESFEFVGTKADVRPLSGSFAKVTKLGINGNLTGTPEGTGMRLVGSSLADGSSPGVPWSSISPGRCGIAGTEVDRIESLSQRYTPTSSPPRAYLSPRDRVRSTKQSPGVLYEQIRQHREILAAEGLLPRSYTPPVPRPVSGPMRPNSLFGVRGALVQDAPCAGRLVAPYATPFAVNVTTPLPSPSDLEKAMGFDYHLHRLPRDGSEASSMRLRRKITLSRAILLLCIVFPPLLLLYGYGMLDVVMATITNGKLTRLSTREKRVALYLGWILAFGAVIGIVVGMIIIGSSGR